MIGRSNAFIKLDGHLTHFAMQKAAREDERLLHYFTELVEDSRFEVVRDALEDAGPQLVRKLVYLVLFNKDRRTSSSVGAQEKNGELKDESVPFEFEELPVTSLGEGPSFHRREDRRVEILFFSDGSVRSHCSCCFISSMGMPCRHWYCIAQAYQEVSATVLQLVHPSWRRDFIRTG
jgi:hypothetical protein